MPSYTLNDFSVVQLLDAINQRAKAAKALAALTAETMLEEAPLNSKRFVRQNAAWVETPPPETPIMWLID